MYAMSTALGCCFETFNFTIVLNYVVFGYSGMGQACDLFSPVICVLRINLQRQVSFICILTQCMMWFFEPRPFHIYYHNFSSSVFFYKWKAFWFSSDFTYCWSVRCAMIIVIVISVLLHCVVSLGCFCLKVVYPWFQCHLWDNRRNN